jgi:HlyD family secretion protein
MRKHIDHSGGNLQGQVLAFPRPAIAPTHVTKIPSWVVVSLIMVFLMIAAGSVAWSVVVKQYGVRYTTMPLTQGRVERVVTTTGTVNPALTTIVGPHVSGAIQSVYCDYTSKVQKGQICAKIDPRPYQAAVNQFMANLAVAKAQLTKDQASFGFARIGADGNAGPAGTTPDFPDAADNTRSVLERMQAQTALDQAAIAQIEAQLEAARVNLEYTDIVSPVDGIVLSRDVTQGQTVSAFQTPALFLIATDLAKMQVDANVSESNFGGMKPGNTASFTVDAFPKRIFEGVVSQVRQWPQTAQKVVTYDVVISIDNPDLALAPGMTASTRIVVDRRNGVLRVPDQALRYAPEGFGRHTASNSHRSDPDGTQLWILRDGQPTAVPVVLGLDDDSFAEIVSGELKPDDQVIVSEQQGERWGSTLPPPRQ